MFLSSLSVKKFPLRLGLFSLAFFVDALLFLLGSVG